MLGVLLSGAYLFFPFFFVPIEWAKNPKVQPWVEGVLIGVVAVWCVEFLIAANEVVHGS
jgi:hypothetical protein